MDSTTHDYLRICHINCQSLFAHLDEFLLSFFMTSDYHIICLSETWLKPTVSDHLVALQRYQLFRCDRTGKNGGGIAFYLFDTLQAKIVRQSEGEYCGRLEYLVAEVSAADGSRLLLAVVYRPLHCGYLADFFNMFLDMAISYTIILEDSMRI